MRDLENFGLRQQLLSHEGDEFSGRSFAGCEMGSCLKEQRECERSVQALEGVCVRVTVCWDDGIWTHRELCPSLAGQESSWEQCSACIRHHLDHRHLPETGIQQDALIPDHFRADAAEEPLLSEPDGAED